MEQPSADLISKKNDQYWLEAAENWRFSYTFVWEQF